MTTVLVTGGAGYIGSHAVLALEAAGHAPVVLDNFSTGFAEAIPGGVPLETGDVGDRAFLAQVLERHRVGAVMHFAGSIIVPESVSDPTKYYRNNTAASLSLIEACLEAGVGPLVFSSTAAVYGAPDRSPVAEGDVTAPINPYGASKLMTERMLFDAAAAHPGFRPVALRYFNVAGADPAGRAGQRTRNATHLVQLAVETALGRRQALEIYGEDYPTRDGSCERDYVHVSDLAAAHVAALAYLEAGGAPEAMNCGYGRGLTVKEVIACLERVIGRPVETRAAPRRAGDPPALVSDPARLKRLTGWAPVHDDIDQILTSALDWQRSLDAHG
ncbi:MAG TPA: UDP-glucose 4-epimerase GalE [Caulobacteraceae bacterium]